MSKSGRLTQDEAYDLLSNSRRRFVISHLRKRGRPIQLDELAAEVAAWENDLPADELTDQHRKRAYVSLYQTHIPKLEEAGIVEFDSDEGTVTLRDGISQLEQFLPTTESRTPPWRAIYAGAAVVGALVYLAGRFGILANVSEASVGLLVVGMFFGIAAVHLLYSKRQSEQLDAEFINRFENG